MMLFNIWLPFFIAAASGLRVPLDIDGLNRIIKSVEPTWKSYNGHDPGSNLASTSQFCAHYYERTRQNHNICNNIDFAVHCYNYCAFRGDIPSLECKDRYSKWCNQQPGLAKFVAKHDQPREFRYWFYYFVSGCYNRVACQDSTSIFKQINTLTTRASKVPQTTPATTTTTQTTAAPAETTTTTKATTEPSTTTESTTTTTTTTTKQPETTTSTSTSSSTTTTATTSTSTSTTSQEPTTSASTMESTEPPATSSTMETTSKPDTGAAEKRPRQPSKEVEQPRWKFNPGRWFNSIHFITG